MSKPFAEQLTELDFANVSPEEFARLVASAAPEDITGLMQGTMRARIIDEIFTRMEHQFRPEAAHSVSATIQWTITGDNDLTYLVTLADGTCTTRREESVNAPTLALTMGDTAFLRLVSGNGSPVTMFMGRELTATGDLALGANLPRMFAIPQA